MHQQGYNDNFPVFLHTMHLPNGKDVRLLSDFAFIDPKYGPITVVAGSETDFASTPRLIWVFLPPFGTYKFAAVIHDYLYRRQTLGFGFFGWRRADRVLWRAMKLSPVKVPAYTRIIIYYGLLLGGWVAYTRAYFTLQEERANEKT